MHIEYLGDLPIPGYGEWNSKSLEDWLHPEHGPLPESLNLVYANREDFRVALWGTSNSIIAAVEMISRNRTKTEQIAADYMRGQVLFTIRWTVDENEVKCWNHSFPIPAQGNSGEADASWKHRIMKALAVESVRVAITTPICPNNDIFSCQSDFKTSQNP